MLLRGLGVRIGMVALLGALLAAPAAAAADAVGEGAAAAPVSVDLQVGEAGRQLLTVSVKGSATSTGRAVRAVLVDPATGARTSTAPLHLTPWWQTLAVSAPVTTDGVRAVVEAVGQWTDDDRFLVRDVAVAAATVTVADVSGRQLLVDGQPYAILGYNYSSKPVGGTGLPSTLVNALGWHSNPEHCTTDANLLGAAGVNTFRMTPLDVYDANALLCMDAFAAAGIRVLWLVNGPGAWQGTDLPAYEEAFRVQLTHVVEQVRDHPITLGYVIGNENSRTRPDLQAAWFGMLDRLAGETKRLDPNHVTTVSLAHPQFYGSAGWGGVGPSVAPNIDMWAINLYGNATGYGAGTWQPLIDKDPSRPVWLSEFGTDRYRCAQHPPGFGLQIPANLISCRASGSGEAPGPQATWDVAAWQDIAANLTKNNPAGAVLGGTLFMWSDEWWFSFPFFTGSTTTQVTHDVTGIGPFNPVTGAPNPFITAHFPDGHFSPEWIGVSHVLRLEQSGPRVTSLAYDGMATEYTGVAGPTVTQSAVASVTACSATVTFSTSVATVPRVDFGRVLLVQQGDLIEADNTIADQSVQGTQSAASHTLTLNDLTPATTYRAYVRGFTSAGRSGTAPALEFTTAAGPCTTS